MRKLLQNGRKILKSVGKNQYWTKMSDIDIVPSLTDETTLLAALFYKEIDP
jgi:hypothetical protein